MSTDNSFSNDAISASTPFSNYVKRDQQLDMEMRETNKQEETKDEDVPVPKKKLC